MRNTMATSWMHCLAGANFTSSANPPPQACRFSRETYTNQEGRCAFAVWTRGLSSIYCYIVSVQHQLHADFYQDLLNWSYCILQERRMNELRKKIFHRTFPFKSNSCKKCYYANSWKEGHKKKIFIPYFQVSISAQLPDMRYSATWLVVHY